MDKTQRIHFLFTGYTKGTLSHEELDELLVWLYDAKEEEITALSLPLHDLWQQAKDGKLPSTASRVNWENVYRTVMQSDSGAVEIPVQGNRWKRRWVTVAAAVIGIGLFVVVYFFGPGATRKEIAQQPVEKNRLPENVMPGNNNAVLTLSGGEKVVLDSAADGRLAEQGGTEVVKLKGGQLAYRAGESRTIVYNTVSTPRAANYQVTLSDGTRVWLNAASSIRFPTVFSDTARHVELTGEAYFEVSKNKQAPFTVLVKRSDIQGGNMEVEVLGTHFNVMAYEDESTVNTTLLEGSVKVKHGNASELLQPGKQVQLSRQSGKLSNAVANVNMAVAWKSGYFYFDKDNVQSIMRQVARWYDLDVRYEGEVTDMLFSGKIEKRLPLSGVLNLFKYEKINFKIEGKQLVLIK
ncbi:MAG: FecR domain-containing protein [Chitinophagaceae bacterium]|nr:FecR domain-containing protein [Chitinophagaceae bacterium]